MLEGPQLAPLSPGPPGALICVLHGLGADGADLLPVGAVYRTALPAALVIAPDAPFPCDIAPMGRMWFSVRDLGPDTRRRGVRVAAPMVSAFLDAALASHRLPPSALVLVGFSQGAMVALHVGLTRPVAPLAILSHSGLLADDALALPANPGWRPPPVLLTHGAADTVLSPDCLAATATALRTRGLEPEVHLLPGLGHGIDEATLRLGLAFLARLGGAGR